ncbi:dihydroorotase [Gossypium arboreum]|uniref:Dihydroorotase n=1 Tax=Gossypium arboreum TaxID=29729 RepID=A0A0B0PX01_GOSAR|nr:dihydroorotase [Gossypium arboreum]
MLDLVQSRIKINFYYITFGWSPYIIVILISNLQHLTHMFNFCTIQVDKSHGFMH